MSWFGSASEWKQGLSSGALSKVEELENQVERLKRERTQKQNQLDSLQQALDNQKRKNDDSTKEKQALEKEIEQLGRSWEQLQLYLKKGQHDHVTSSVTLLPPRQTSVADSHTSQSGEDTNSFQKKLDELMCENKDLRTKLLEQNVPHQVVDIITPSTAYVVGDNDRDFWGNFGGKSNLKNQRTPHKTPVKKAIETSKENPFRVPYGAPDNKGLGISEGNTFRTSRCQLSFPTTSATTPTDEYTKHLEKMVDQYKKEIEGLQSSSSVPHDMPKLQQEVASLKIALDKSNAELAAREKSLKALEEQQSSFKSTAEEVAGKLEITEQRMRAVQSELDCQRHNSEAVRKNLEEKLKEREKELNADITQAQNDMIGMERQICDLQTKLQQQETLTRNTQNSLQASLDKAVAQIAILEKDHKVCVSRSSQLEAEVAKLEKSAEDSAKILNQFRQEKEMAVAETSGLKVKLKAAESSTQKLSNRLELAEQLAENRKLVQEQLQSEKDKAVKDAENSITKLSKEISKLQEELKAMEAQRNETQEAIISTNKECDRKLAGIHAMEAEVSEMQAQVAETNAEMESLRSETASLLEATKAEVNDAKVNAEAEVAKIREATAQEVERAKREAAKRVELKHQETVAQLDQMKEQITEAERKTKAAEEIALEAQKKQEVAHGEKLAAEVSAWELEGTIDSLKAEILQHQEATDAMKSEAEAVMKDKAETEKCLEEQIREKEKAVQSLSSALEDKQSSILESESKCWNIEVQLEALTKENKQMETHSKEVQKQLTVKISDLSKVLEEKEVELTERCREVENINSQLANAQTEKMELTDQLEKLNTKTEEIFKDNQNLENKYEKLIELKQQMEEQTESIEKQHHNRIASLNQILEEHKVSFEKNQTQVENLTTHLETQIAENKKLVENSERIKAENEERLSIVQSALEVAENHSCELNSQVEMLRTQVHHFQSAFENKTESLMQEKVKLKQAHDDLKSSMENLDREYQEKLRKLVEAEQEICQLTASVEEKSKAFEQITSDLVEKEKLVEMKETEVANGISRENQLEKLVEEVSNNLKASERLCEGLKSSLEEKDNQLSQNINGSQLLADELDNLKNKLETANDEICGMREDRLQFQATLEELEGDKNSVVNCLQEQLSCLTREKEGLMERLCQKEENYKNASRNHHEAQIQLTNLLDEKSSQLVELQQQLKEHISTIGRLREELSHTTAEKDQWEEERCSWRSTLDNMELAKNTLALELEKLRDENGSLSERLECSMEAYTTLQSSNQEIEAANQQLQSSLNEKSEELEQLVISQRLLQEQNKQQASKAEESLLDSIQKEVELKEREIENLMKQHVSLSQEHKEVKEQLDSAMRTLKTAKERMVDIKEYHEVCQEKEFLRSQHNDLQDEYIKMISKFDHEREKAENIKRDFDNYRAVILMMGHQQDHTQNNEMAQIQKENEDLISRLKHFEKSNGQMLSAICSLRQREATLTRQLQATTEVSGNLIHSEGVYVSLQVDSEDMQNSLKPCGTCKIMSDKLETLGMQLKDAETTISNVQQQLNVANEELGLLRGENEMKSEECSRVMDELIAKEIDDIALEKLYEDLKNEVASRESKALQDKENIRTLEEAVEHLENRNCKLMTQLEGYTTELVMMKSSEHKDENVDRRLNELREEDRSALQREVDLLREQLMISQNQLKTLTSLEDQLKNEAHEAKEKLNQAMYDLQRTQDQNKVHQNIAEELEDRVISLEAELKTSSETHKKFQEEIKRLRSSSSMHQVNSCAEQPPNNFSRFLTDLQEECDSLREKNNCLNEQLDKMEKGKNINLEFEGSRNKSEELAFLNEELSSKNDELTTKNDLLIYKNEELTTMIDDLKVELNELTCQNNILKSNAETLSKKEAEHLFQIQDHLAVKQELENQLHTASQRLEEVISGNKELITRNTEVVFQNETLITENKSLLVSLQENSLNLQELEELRERVKHTENERGIIEKQCQDLEATILDSTHSKKELKFEKEKLLDNIKELENKFSQNQMKTAKISVSEMVTSENDEVFGSSQELTEKYKAIVTERNQILEENIGLHSERLELLMEREKILNDKMELFSEKEKLQSKIEQVEKEKDELMSERGFLKSQKQELQSEKDSSLNDNMALGVEKEAQLAEKGILLTDKQQMLTEREQLQSENERISQENKDLLSEKELLRAELLSVKKELESEIEKMKKEKDKMSVENELLLKQKVDLQSKENLILNDKMHLLSEKEALQSAKEHILKEKNELLTEKEVLEMEKQELLSEKQQLLVDQEHSLSKTEKISQENEALLSEKELLLTEKDQLKKDVEDLVSKNALSNSEKENLNGKIEGLKVEKEQMMIEMQQQKSALELKEMDIEDLHANIENLTSFKVSLMTEKDHLARSNENLLKENKVLVEKVTVLQSKDHEISRLSSEISQHITDKEHMTSEVMNLRSEKNEMQVEKEEISLNLENMKTHLKLTEEEKETQNKILEGQKEKIETLQSAIDDLKEQLQNMGDEAVTMKKDLAEKTEEAVRLIGELVKVKEDLRVSQDNLANKLSETTNLMVANATLEVDMANLKDKIATAAVCKESLAVKKQKMKELESLVKESRRDLESLRAKFSLNKKIVRKKEEEMKQCLRLIESLEAEIKHLKEKVKAAEEESSNRCKQLEEVTQQVDHWQKRFHDKNTEVEEQAAKHIEVFKKMLDLEEAKDNLKAKVMILQAQMKKKNIDSCKMAPQVEANKQKKEVNAASDISYSDICNPVKEGTKSQDLQVSDSQEIIGSSQTVVPQVTRVAVTRRAPRLYLTTGTSVKGSGRTQRPRRSQANILDEKSVSQISQLEKTSMQHSEVHTIDDATPPGDEAMKRAKKRVSSSISVLKDKRKCQSDVTAVPESPGSVEGLPSNLKHGLNDIPSVVECPGVMQRSTALSKKMDSKEKLLEKVGGPLKSLSNNSPVRRSSRRIQHQKYMTTDTRTKAPCSASRGEECKTQ